MTFFRLVVAAGVVFAAIYVIEPFLPRKKV